MKRTIRVGSRESRLAMVQTAWVVDRIREKHPELDFEITGINTKGDALLDTRLDKIGGKGLFIKELELALLDGVIDLAVHSLKDMPAEIPEELTIAAYSKREDPRDVLVTTDGRCLEGLNEGSVIGTSSIRREVQLQCLRPDLRFKTLRGNVLTRLNKLSAGEYDAIVLAAAGLKRLGLEERCVQYFRTADMIPSVGQGILAVEARRGDENGYLADSVECTESRRAAAAERAFMMRLNGSCTTPMAAHAVIDGESMKVSGMLALDDKRVLRAAVEGNKNDAAQLGFRLADDILGQF